MILATKAAATPSQGLGYLWLAGGASGKIYTSTSTTASTWTERTNSFATQVNYIASNRTTLYVAVGNTGNLSTSPDGITWTSQTSSFGTTNINGVAFYNGTWVAVGASGKIATSTDGATWTQRTSGTANTLLSVAYGNGLWVTTGSTSTCLTATDPTSTWTSRTSTVGVGTKVYYAPSQAIWVLGTDAGGAGALASSTDGTTWTARTSPFTAALVGTGFTSNTSVIVFGNSTGVSPNTCDIASSTNGTTWTDRDPADTAQLIYDAASDEAGLLVVAGSKIQTSSDGTTWTDRGAVASGWSALTICHSSGVPAIR